MTSALFLIYYFSARSHPGAAEPLCLGLVDPLLGPGLSLNLLASVDSEFQCSSLTAGQTSDSVVRSLAALFPMSPFLLRAAEITTVFLTCNTR